MELQNGYKILYSKVEKDTSTEEYALNGYASKKLPDAVGYFSRASLIDADWEDVHLSDYKLIYQIGNQFYGSTSYLPDKENDDLLFVIDVTDNLILGGYTITPIFEESATYEEITGLKSYVPGDDAVITLSGTDTTLGYNATAVDDDGNSIEVTGSYSSDTNKWSFEFEMPASNVTITIKTSPLVD